MSEPDISLDLSELLLKHRHALGGYIQACVHNHQDAEDIYQEVWLAALKSSAQLVSAEGALPWLLTIAKNRIKNHFGTSKKRLTVVDPDLAMKLAEAAQRIEARCPASLRAEALTSCLDELPPRHRTLVARWYADSKLRIAELASEIGASLNAVSAKLKRIRKALRKCTNGKLSNTGAAT